MNLLILSRLTMLSLKEKFKLCIWHLFTFASIDLLQKEECWQNIAAVTAMNTRFARQTGNHHAAKKVRTPGTIMAFELNKGKGEYLNTASSGITASMLSKGIYGV